MQPWGGCRGIGRTASTPQLESPELPATSATEPREPGRAPPLKSTGARSLVLHQTMGTPEEPRPPGGGSRGRPTPLLSPRSHPGLNPQLAAPPPHQAASPGTRDKSRGSSRASHKRQTPPARQVSGPPPLQASPVGGLPPSWMVPIQPSPLPKSSQHPPARSEPPGHTLSTNRPGRAQKRQTAARDLAARLRIG